LKKKGTSKLYTTSELLRKRYIEKKRTKSFIENLKKILAVIALGKKNEFEKKMLSRQFFSNYKFLVIYKPNILKKMEKNF